MKVLPTLCVFCSKNSPELLPVYNKMSCLFLLSICWCTVLRGRLHDEFQPAPRAEILLRLRAWFQPGLKFEIARKSERPPSCFVGNTIFEHAQAHFSARAESLMRLHEVYMNFSPGWKSQPSFTNRAGNLSPGWNFLHVIANVFLIWDF